MKKTLYLILKILIILILIISTVITGLLIYYKSNYENESTDNADIKNSKLVELYEQNLINNEIIQNDVSNEMTSQNQSKDLKVELPGENIQIITEIDDWRLVLVNSENTLPENFEVELANYDSTRQFDSRAIGELIRNDKRYEKS